MSDFSPTADASEQAPNEWPVRDEVVEYETDWFTAGYDLVERPDGEEAKYYWTHPSDAVSVVAVEDGELVLVEQYRPRFRDTFLECPGGGIDEGETVVDAAARELREETGFAAGHLEQLTTYYPSGWDRYTRSVVFATDLTPAEQELDDGEYLHVRTVSVEAAVAELHGDPDDPSVGWGLPPVLVAREAGLL